MGLARDEPDAGRLLRQAGGGLVLVLDLAEDLLEQILQGDQAGDAAELVHPQGQLGAGPLEVAQEVGHGLALRHEVGGLHEGAQRRLGAVRQLHQVLDQQHAAHLVNAALEDGQAGVAAGGEGGPGLEDRGLQGQGDDARAGRHHFAHHGVAEADHVADELPVLGLEDALGLALFQQRGDGLVRGFLFLDVAGLVFGLLPSDALRHRVHHQGQGRHGRGEEGEQPLQPEARIPGGQHGRKHQVQQPEGGQQEDREGPAPAQQGPGQGPGQGGQGQQQGLVP